MKFKIKVVICMVCIMSLVYGIGSAALITSSFNSMLNREKQSAVNSYKMLLGTLQLVGGEQDWRTISDIVNIVKRFGDENFDSWSSLRLYADDAVLYKKGNVSELFSEKHGDVDLNHYRLSYLNLENKKYLKISGAMAVNDKNIYIDIAFDISNIYDNRREQSIKNTHIFLAMIVICGFLSYVAAVLLTRNLSNLLRTSRNIASGDISARTRIKSNDEIGRLAREFDNMAQSIENNVTKLEEDMEKQNQFVGNFTHELKTPMTSIIGYAELIRSEALSRNEEIEAANYIYSEGKRLERMSLKLLDIFVLDNRDITFTESSPMQIITSVVEMQRLRYGARGIDIICECQEGKCSLEPDLIRSLLMNLLDNARKAMDGTGRIHIIQKMTRNGCVIQVKDNGKGMPGEAIKHVTEAFYRVDKSRSREKGGAGLGLALCKKIVEIHEGSIEFESEKGRGTTVTVTLGQQCESR